MSKQPESRIFSDIKKAASKRWVGVAVLFRSAAGSGVPVGANHPIEVLPVGGPDGTLLIRGRLMGVETKTKIGRPRECQLTMARTWRLSGVPYVFPRSVEEFMTAVEREFPPEVWADPTAEERAGSEPLWRRRMIRASG